MQRQMNMDHDKYGGSERNQLDSLRKQFMKEMDRKIQEKFDDWDIASNNNRNNGNRRSRH